MLTLYLIRHGQTDFNNANIVQGGGVDSNLNETGRMQGQNFFDHYRHLHFDAVVHSGLRRTKQTVEPFLERNLPFHEIPELNEISWGVIEGMETTRDVKERFERVTSKWQLGVLDEKIEGGESAIGCWNRVEVGLNKIKALFPKGGRLVVCTHGRILRVLLSQVTAYGLPVMNIFPHENTALNLLHYSPNGKLFIEKLNDTSHLH